MICFEGLLVAPAKEAGILTPPDELLDAAEESDPKWDSGEYPHFHAFCVLQLSRAMSSPDEHWQNAKIIAAITPEQIRTMTLQDFIEAGLIYPI